MKIWDFGDFFSFRHRIKNKEPPPPPQGTTAAQWSITETMLYTGRLPSRSTLGFLCPLSVPSYRTFLHSFWYPSPGTKNRIYRWSLISTIWFRLFMFNAGSQCWQLIHFPNSYIIKSQSYSSHPLTTTIDNRSILGLWCTNCSKI